ncbi:MAG: serine/threonine protein kinase [Oligoflexia bacterium]|nr:serine/threonine protein kinase [Oligoflexia bacterium]
MAFHPHKFGRYVIVDPIAVGGMAEIYRARLSGGGDAASPDRIIVIKKVIANLSQNSEFIQMFEEEIKITVGLTHPNIIQIYDYGKVEDQYFMAMEYVEGKNLRQFVKRLADMKSMFSIDMSCHIISQVCHALAYAHSFKDRLTGKSLGIVHRDISPQNVMISYDGAVKLFDFGIAKAKSASEATRAGVIKGKPSYLSPEQINGEELDGRSDIFALGIVLWELLTAKRLFIADTDMGVLRLIQSAKIEPPSTFNPAVPQSLDAIILKSLQRDKNKRYQNAEEFQRDLHKFLYSFNPGFNPADLSYYAQELFKKEIGDDKIRLAKYLALEPVGEGSGDASPIESPKKGSLSTKLAEGLISTTDFNKEMLDSITGTGTCEVSAPSDLQMASTTGFASPKNVQVPKPGTPPLPGQKTNAISGLSTENAKTIVPPGIKKPGSSNLVIPPWSKQSSGSSGAVGGSGKVVGASTHTQLRRAMDKNSSAGSRNVAVLLIIFVVGLAFVGRQYGLFEGTPLEAFLGSSKKNTKVTSVDDGPTRNPSASGNQTSAPVGKDEGVVVLRIPDFKGVEVTVNGVPGRLYRNQLIVPLNQHLVIEVAKAGYKSVTKETVVNSSTPVFLEIPLQPVASGIVNFNTTPAADITFIMDGKEVFKGTTPINNQRIPIGRYKVIIENKLINHRSEAEIVIDEGMITRVERIL